MSTKPLPSLRELGYYTPDEVAGLTGVSTLTLRNWRNLGKGPSYSKRNDRDVVYPIDDMKRWLKSRTLRPGSKRTLAPRAVA